MTKRELVVRISDETHLTAQQVQERGLTAHQVREAQLSQQQVHEVIQKTLDYISEAMANGETVELRNFGVFEVKIRKARVGRNPNAPATDVPIPPRAVVKFKPGKEMREAVLKRSPKPAQPSP